MLVYLITIHKILETQKTKKNNMINWKLLKENKKGGEMIFVLNVKWIISFIIIIIIIIIILCSFVGCQTRFVKHFLMFFLCFALKWRKYQQIFLILIGTLFWQSIKPWKIILSYIHPRIQFNPLTVRSNIFIVRSVAEWFNSSVYGDLN